MSPSGFLQYLHAADPSDAPADGEVPVYSSAGNGYVPTSGINGNVTAAGTLTNNDLVIGQGSKAIATTTTATGILTFLGTPSSANLASAITDETGSGALVFASTPTLVTPVLGTPTSGTLTNCTGLPEAGLTLSNNTTNNVTTARHGFAPILPNVATQYLDGTGNYSVPGGGGGGGTVGTTGSPASGNLSKFSGSTTITNGDLSGDISTSGTLVTTIGAAKVTEAMQVLADNTTQDVSTSKHGYMPKLPSGVPGVLLGYNSYSPGTDTPFTINSSTLTDVDATNMKVVFTVPTSGKVLVRLTAYGNSGSAGNDYWWSIRDGSTDITGAGGAVTTTTGASVMSVSFVITGLTPGTSTTWKWSHARSTSGNGRVFAGPGGKATPPAVMEVWAA